MFKCRILEALKGMPERPATCSTRGTIQKRNFRCSHFTLMVLDFQFRKGRTIWRKDRLGTGTSEDPTRKVSSGKCNVDATRSCSMDIGLQLFILLFGGNLVPCS